MRVIPTKSDDIVPTDYVTSRHPMYTDSTDFLGALIYALQPDNRWIRDKCKNGWTRSIPKRVQTLTQDDKYEQRKNAIFLPNGIAVMFTNKRNASARNTQRLGKVLIAKKKSHSARWRSKSRCIMNIIHACSTEERRRTRNTTLIDDGLVSGD